MANPIKELIESAIDSMDGMFTAESIIGDSVSAPDGTLIIPIAKVSFGVGGGGCEFKETNADGTNRFGGGVGAGASIKPEGFLVITKGGSIRFVDYAPDMVERISGIFKKDNEASEDA